MNLTGKYILTKEFGPDKGLKLIFDIDNLHLIEWFIPNTNSLINGNHYIAIEKRYIEHGREKSHYIDNLKNVQGETYEIVDFGKIRISYLTESKYEVLIISEYANNLDRNKNIVMVVPSWGRWTKSRLWNLIVK